MEDLVVQLHRKDMRSLRLTVTSEGEVRLSLPHHVSDSEALIFLKDRTDWIRKHLERIEKIKESEPSDFSSIPFLGTTHPVEIIHHPIAPRVLMDAEGKISVYLKLGATKAVVPGVLDTWYRIELKKRLEALIREWEPIMDVQVKSFQLKRMKTRWGTCNVVDHRIWFNVELAKKSFPCIEYIVVHEMCHLLERGHGPKFKACMDKYLPHWRQLRLELNGKGIKY
ncbi:MAG TPA: SprT family zinc-dependent metalloprotease [Bacteroidales bacterium]|nr:SprT family zinc-dependent metalloprotease [Bacteroidales bacterium]